MHPSGYAGRWVRVAYNRDHVTLQPQHAVIVQGPLWKLWRDAQDKMPQEKPARFKVYKLLHLEVTTPKHRSSIQTKKNEGPKDVWKTPNRAETFDRKPA